jgi:hypothetical protein
MLVIPIEQSLLYVQPIYIRATSENETGSGIPEFKFAIVSFNGDIKMRATLDEALAAIFGGSGGDGPPDDGGDGGDGGDGEVPPDVAALLDAMQQAFAEADAALRAGDLATYAAKVAAAQALLAQALELIGQPTAPEAPAAG